MEPTENTESTELKKRTFIAYDKDGDEFTEVGRYKGWNPSQAAKKAVNKKAKETGATKDIEVILREAGKRRKSDGKRMFRYYTGAIEDQVMTSGDIASFHEDIAIKNESWVLNTDGTVAMSPFPDGFDSTDDPRLQGKRASYTAKVATTKYLKTEPIPEGMRLSAPVEPAPAE